MDRKGHPIEYYPPCLDSRMGSTTPILKKLMKTPAAPAILTYQSSKRKVARGVTQKTTTRKRLCRTKPSAAQVNQLISLLTLIFNFWSNSLLQPSSIAPQSILGANYCPRHLNQHPPSSHRLFPLKSRLQLKQLMFLIDFRWQKMSISLFHLLMLSRYPLKPPSFISFYSLLTIYLVRLFVKSYLHKNKGLIIHQLMIILLTLMPKLLILQLSK